jgi:hypothetical protein
MILAIRAESQREFKRRFRQFYLEYQSLLPCGIHHALRDISIPGSAWPLILQTLQGEMSRGELMEKLRLKDRMHFRMDYLRPALAAELIQMTIPDKPRSSKQKYRLTDKGREALRERKGNI